MILTIFFYFLFLFFQIATIGLAADANPFGVVLGGILYGQILIILFSSRLLLGIILSWLFNIFWFRGQALCTTAAVLGGKSLASQISEKMVSKQSLFYPTSTENRVIDININSYLFTTQVCLSSGLLFLAFGIQSLLSTAGESYWTQATNIAELHSN